MSTSMKIAVKIESNGVKRLLRIPPLTFDDLLENFKEKFESTLPEKFTIQYKDPDEEWIRISSTQDITNAYGYIQSTSVQKSITFVVNDAISSNESSILEDANERINKPITSSDKYDFEGTPQLHNEEGILNNAENEECQGQDDESDSKTERHSNYSDLTIKKSKSAYKADETKSLSDYEIKSEIGLPNSEMSILKSFAETLLRVKPTLSELSNRDSQVNQAQVDLINEIINVKLRHALAAVFFEKNFGHTEEGNILCFAPKYQEMPVSHEKNAECFLKKSNVEKVCEELKTSEKGDKPADKIEKKEVQSSESTIKRKMNFKCKVVSCPENLKVEPGSEITAVFLVQNNGADDWPSGVELMGNTGWSDDNITQKIGLLAVGERTEIRLHLTAGDKEGNFLPCFKFYYKDEKGSAISFGPRLSFEVKVKRIPSTTKADYSITCEKKTDQLGESNSQVLELASKLQSIFPDKDQKTFIQFIKSNGLQNKEISEVVQQYLDQGELS